MSRIESNYLENNCEDNVQDGRSVDNEHNFGATTTSGFERSEDSADD